MKFAIIDLGTNTFHCAIVKNGKIIEKKSIAAKLGAEGISKKIITKEAFKRAEKAFREFNLMLIKHKIMPHDVKAIATSAVRNAVNGSDFRTFVWDHFGIAVKIIEGDTEADYIYEGVKNAVKIKSPSLIMDIGGGSVEFIICNESKKLWQASFEIGGLRLMEKFMDTDPISGASIEKMNDYFYMATLDLHNAIHQYQPSTLIGSSGSFDTLNDMYYAKQFNTKPPEYQAGFEYPISEFYWAYEQLVFNDRNARLAIPGMIALRVDMIVVAMCLIAYIIKKFDFKHINISNYSLLEGVMLKKD